MVFRSLVGEIAAGVTTPLDVLKTRIILQRRSHGEARAGGVRVVRLFAQIKREEGMKSLFRGFGPKVAWISVGRATPPGTGGATK